MIIVQQAIDSVADSQVLETTLFGLTGLLTQIYNGQTGQTIQSLVFKLPAIAEACSPNLSPIPADERAVTQSEVAAVLPARTFLQSFRILVSRL
jgi:hypothetical protein